MQIVSLLGVICWMLVAMINGSENDKLRKDKQQLESCLKSKACLWKKLEEAE